eukprot:s1252_g1.t1
MDQLAFENFLDASLQTLREHLVSAYPDIIKASFDSPDRLSNLSRGLQKIGSASPGSLSGGPLPTTLLRVAATNSGPSDEAATSSSTVRFCEEIAIRDRTPTFPESLVDVDEEEPDNISHGNSSAILKSDLEELTEEERRQVRHRLRARLGTVSQNRLVSGRSLHDSLSALGLTRYTVQDYNELLNHLSSFVNLAFEEDEDQTSWSGSTLDIFGLLPARFDPLEASNPVWEWPQLGEASLGLHREKSMNSVRGTEQSKIPLLQYDVAPLEVVMQVFLATDSNMHKRIFGTKLLKQYKAVKEILLAGDTNRLVAELTFVRINDLAVPSEPIHFLLYLEPLIALIIVANGICIGIQTDPTYENWHGWLYVELGFVTGLSLELITRILILGCRDFWCGAEQIWNYFDMFLTSIGIVDVIWQFASTASPDIVGTLLLRCFRLVRLARVVRVFRLKIMSDLRLMLRGLIAGVWTLALSFLLLFAVLYVIAGLASFTIGRDRRIDELGLHGNFYNIPVAMFTTFRCFIGDCNTQQGRSITQLLTDEFGVPFVLGYVVSYMLVAMGIFNVILAVYVDITMKAAKENDAVTAEQYSRESIRIARATRELLKKFAAAYHVFHIMEDHAADVTQLEITHSATLFTDDEIHEDVAITKELFLLVIQDPSVQALMDELDLPPFRAHLFEVIDADGSGTLHIQDTGSGYFGFRELVQGLLKLRGEVNKGDVVAPLLATRSVQEMVGEMQKANEAHMDSLRSELSQHAQKLEWICSLKWDSPAPKREEIKPLGPGLRSLAVPLRPQAKEAEVESLPPS